MTQPVNNTSTVPYREIAIASLVVAVGVAALMVWQRQNDQVSATLDPGRVSIKLPKFRVN